MKEKVSTSKLSNPSPAWERVRDFAVITLPLVAGGLAICLGRITSQRPSIIMGSSPIFNWLAEGLFHRIRLGSNWKKIICSETGHAVNDYDKAMTQKRWVFIMEKLGIDKHYTDQLGHDANNYLKGTKLFTLLPIYDVYKRKEREFNRKIQEKLGLEDTYEKLVTTGHDIFNHRPNVSLISSEPKSIISQFEHVGKIDLGKQLEL